MEWWVEAGQQWLGKSEVAQRSHREHTQVFRKHGWEEKHRSAAFEKWVKGTAPGRDLDTLKTYGEELCIIELHANLSYHLHYLVGAAASWFEYNNGTTGNVTISNREKCDEDRMHH